MIRFAPIYYLGKGHPDAIKARAKYRNAVV
jgi:hypothetical protein